MSEYNRHRWAMEWMYGGGRDPNGRGLDDEIRIGKEDWMERQRVAQGGRIGLQSGQLVQPGPGRPGYAGDDFITFPLKKYSDAILDKQIRLVSTKPGISQHGASKTLREIFEVVARTQGGQTMIDEFKKNPTEEAFTKLRRRRKYRLDFEKDQKLSPKEKSRLRKQQYQSEKKWRESEKGKAYRARLLAEQGIFPAGTSEERVWRDIYKASQKKLTGSGMGRFEEASRFKIRFPKHIKIDPKTGLPKAVKSASGKMYVPWDNYYKDIYFYDTVTKKNIKFGGVEKWMTDNLPKGAKKYKNAIENYDIKLAIEELPVKYKGQETSLVNAYKQKITNPKLHFFATPVNVNHAGLSRDEFWKTEVTTSSGNNKINAILQEKSSQYKIADTKVARNKIMKEAATEVNKIAGGATGIFQKKKVGIDPTPKKVIKTIAQELRFGKKTITKLFKSYQNNGIGGHCKWKKAEGGRIGFAAGGYDDCMSNAIQEHNNKLQSDDLAVRNDARAKQFKINKTKGLKNILGVGRRGLQGVAGFIGGWGGAAIEAVAEGAFYEHARRQGYNHKQAMAETFLPKVFDKNRETGIWEGAENLLADELVGKRDEEGYLKSATPHQETWFNVPAAEYQDNLKALENIQGTIGNIQTELNAMKANPDYVTPEQILAKEQELEAALTRGESIANKLKVGTPEQEANVRAEEKQKALQDKRAQEHWGDTEAYKGSKQRQWQDEFLDYRGADRKYRKEQPFAFKGGIEANIGPTKEESEKGMRIPWEEVFPRTIDTSRTTEQQKWDYIINQGGFDLMDKISAAGGVANIAEGGIASLKKK